MTEGLYSRRDIDNLQMILKYCEDIGKIIILYGSDDTEFKENISLQYSSVFALGQIGEHVKRLYSEFKKDHPDIDWKSIAGMRDRMAHDYANISISRVRSTILEDIPDLREKCRFVLDGLNSRDRSEK